MVRATAALAILLLAGSAQAEPMTPEIIQLEDEPIAEKVVLADELPAADDFRLDVIVNPFTGYQFPVVNEIVDPFRDGVGPARVRAESYAELCRRYCQDPPQSASPESSPRYVPPSLHSSERERLFEQRHSNADLRLMGGVVLAGTVLGAIMLVAGDPVFENEAGVFGTSVLIGSGLVVGLALVTTGDKVELRFARNNVARAR
jgi:hypothetical protein